VVAVVSIVVGACSRAPARPSSPLPLQSVGEVALPGDGSRFDYASLDSARRLLFIAHRQRQTAAQRCLKTQDKSQRSSDQGSLGAGEVIEADVGAANTVVRTIPYLAQVHGVLVVPDLHRVYATATGDNQIVFLDEDTGAVLNRAPTGHYPDGLACDPKRGAVWTTNETGGSETVIDATTAAVRGSVDMGGEAGNVAYDSATDRMLVAVQAHGDLAVINPATLSVTPRIGLPGCDHPHGLALDPVAGAAFLGCDGNATVLSVDVASARVTGSTAVGQGPDVLAYDPGAHRLYVAAESGEVSILDERDGTLHVTGSDHLADGAHAVAVDPASHRSYYPIPSGSGGHPVLLERAPTH
jgi:DNA-binding beta-propeller fold protein YncE